MFKIPAVAPIVTSPADEVIATPTSPFIVAVCCADSRRSVAADMLTPPVVDVKLTSSPVMLAFGACITRLLEACTLIVSPERTETF